MTVINANALSMDDSQEESLTGATPTLSPEKPKTPRSSQQDQDRTIPFTLSPPDEELSPPHSLAPAALARAHPTVFKTKAMATAASLITDMIGGVGGNQAGKRKKQMPPTTQAPSQNNTQTTILGYFHPQTTGTQETLTRVPSGQMTHARTQTNGRDNSKTARTERTIGVPAQNVATLDPHTDTIITRDSIASTNGIESSTDMYMDDDIVTERGELSPGAQIQNEASFLDYTDQPLHPHWTANHSTQLTIQDDQQQTDHIQLNAFDTEEEEDEETDMDEETTETDARGPSPIPNDQGDATNMIQDIRQRTQNQMNQMNTNTQRETMPEEHRPLTASLRQLPTDRSNTYSRHLLNTGLNALQTGRVASTRRVFQPNSPTRQTQPPTGNNNTSADLQNCMQNNLRIGDTVRNLKTAVENIDNKINTALQTTERKLTEWYTEKTATLKEGLYGCIKNEIKEALNITGTTRQQIAGAVQSAVEAAQTCQTAALNAHAQQTKINTIETELLRTKQEVAKLTQANRNIRDLIKSEIEHTIQSAVDIAIQNRVPTVAYIKEQVIAQIGHEHQDHNMHERIELIETAIDSNTQDVQHLQFQEMQRDIQDAQTQVLIAKIPTAITATATAREATNKLLALLQVPNDVANQIKAAKYINATGDQGPRIKIFCASPAEATTVRVTLIKCKTTLDKGIAANAPWVTVALAALKPLSIRIVIPRRMINAYSFMELQAQSMKRERICKQYKISWFRSRLLLKIRNGTWSKFFEVSDNPQEQGQHTLTDITEEMNRNRTQRNTHPSEQVTGNSQQQEDGRHSNRRANPDQPTEAEQGTRRANTSTNHRQRTAEEPENETTNSGLPQERRTQETREDPRPQRTDRRPRRGGNNPR